MTTEKYYVYGNLNHDGREYGRGEQVSLPEDAAQPLLEAGVIGTDKVEAPAPAEAPQEPAREANVGGAPEVSGEPSIDQPAADTAAAEAEDVTPKVSERMTREELEDAAKAAGISDETIALAKTKASVVELITHAVADEPEHDASANL